MSVKNEEAYLETCLQSILDQSEKKWELVVMDDGSADNSMEILRSFESKDPRIRVCQNPGHGIINALECAFQKSKGEFISRMDADDLMHPDKLKSLKKAFDGERKLQISVCQVQYFSSMELGSGYKQYEKWINDLINRNSVFSEIYKECVIPSCAWMARKSDMLENKMFDDLQIPEDYDLSFRFYQHHFKVIPVTEKLHLWRDHEHRTSRTNPLYNIRKFDVFKLRHFVRNELSKEDQLVIWGAGDKGKRMIKYLVQNKTDVRWITKNNRKINQRIYSALLESPEILKSLNRVKIIVALSNPDDKKNVEIYLNILGLTLWKDYFFFF